MRFRSFRARLLVLFIGLIAIANVGTFVAVLRAMRESVMEQEHGELRTGGRVFSQLLRDHERQLQASVEVLTGDFAFREAVATQDAETIRSALENHGGRVDANLMVLVSLAGEVIAATRDEALPAGVPLPLDALLRTASARGHAAGVVVFDDVPYQAVLVPVKAPVAIAWVLAGFVMDDRLAREFQGITHLDVSFWLGSGNNGPGIVASSLPSAERSAVAAALAAGVSEAHAGMPFVLDRTEQLTLEMPLREAGGTAVIAVLQTSLAEALRPYLLLQAHLIILAAVALTLSIAGAILVGRSVTRPVQNLVAAARRILGGRYDVPVEVATRDELGVLAETMNDMQRGIAQREDRILHGARHDVLTGLPNRTTLAEDLGRILESVRGRGGALAVVMLDLRRFRAVNDALGHEIGDHVLKEIARRLRAACPGTDLVVRLGSDEFVCVLTAPVQDRVLAAAQGIEGALAGGVGIEDLLVPVRVRLGIALHPLHGDGAAVLLRRADVALQHAKDRDLSCLVYEEGEDERRLRQLAIVDALGEAVSGGQLRMHYQPKLDVRTREVVQVEALLRWQHPVHGAMRPDEFIPLAEQSGHIRELTAWVVEEGIRQARRWQDRGLHVGVAVNVSAGDLLSLDLPNLVPALLARHGVPARMIVLEVTESAIMRNLTESLDVLARLKGCGVGLAIDDFGTGHSSLAQLKRMPVDELKIDKSFVQHLKPGTDDETIVRAIIDLGHNMNLHVVAEGIEDAEGFALLESLSCDVVQGYFVSRPLDPDAFECWLAEFYESGPLVQAIDPLALMQGKPRA